MWQEQNFAARGLKISDYESLTDEKLMSKDTINPLQLFVEKHQFFNQKYQWLNNIIYR